MAFSDYLGMSEMYEPPPNPVAEPSTYDKISGWLANPSNQAALLALGKGFSGQQLLGGKLTNTLGANIADAMLPMAQGQIAQQGAQGAAKAISQGQLYPGTLSQKKFSDTGEDAGIDSFKFSNLASPHVTGYTMTVKPDGTKTYKVDSPGPRDYTGDPIQNAIHSQYAANGISQRRNFSEDVGTLPFASRPGQGGGQASPEQTPSLASSMTGVRVPPQYAVYYQSAASKYGIPLNTFIAIHKNESGFDPARISPKGAVGLGQVMPSTGQMFGVSREQLLNPLVNIDVSARYIRHLADTYGIDLNNPGQVAMAYNGGPNGMRNADMNYVQRVVRDSGESVDLADLRSAGASPTIRQVQATSVPGLNYSRYQPPNFSNMPSLRGLSPEQVSQVYSSGISLARAPATINVENARAENERADAAIKRLGLPAATPVEVDGVVTTGREALEYSAKLREIGSRKQYYQTLADSAKTREEQSLYLNEARKAQAEERQAKTEALNRRNEFINAHKDEKPPGSDLTWGELDATGNIERYLGHRQQANTEAIQQSKIVAAAEKSIRTSIMKKYTEQIGGLRILGQEAKAKGFKSADDYINAQVHAQMSGTYGPGWKGYLPGGQGEAAIVDPLGIRK